MPDYPGGVPPATQLGDPTYNAGLRPSEDTYGGDPNSNPGQLTFDPKLYAAIQKIAHGGTLQPNEVPTGFNYKNGKLEPQGASALKIGLMALAAIGIPTAADLIFHAAVAGGGVTATSAVSGGTTAATGSSAAPLSLSAIEGGAAGLPASTVAALPGASAVAASPSVASRVWDYLKQNGPDLGAAVGEATQGAANRDQNNNNNLANAAEINRRANSDYQTSLQNLSQQERDQRASDVTNLRRQSFAQHPLVSPFDPTGGPHYSDSYMQGLSDIEKQALTRLHQPPTYDPTTIAPTKPTPYVPNTSVGTGRTVGNWLSTILGLL